MKVKVSTSPTQTELEEVDLSLTTRRGSECLIGRSPDSDLVLDSDDVSRLHGKFFSQAGHYYFCDVGSRNGSIVNGKLAEKDHSYVLKNGDIIRIGDFVLILEEEIQSSQQEETVVRIINPSVFSNWRPQNENVASQESQPAINQSSQELVGSHPAAEINQTHEELEKQEIVNTSEEVEETKQQVEPVEQSEPTFIQPEDVIRPDSAIESPHESNEVSEYTHEATVVQLSDVNQDHDATTDIEHQTENVASTEHEEVATHTNEQKTEEAVHQDEEARETSEAENVEVDTPSQQVEEELVSGLVSDSVSISTQSLQSEEIATSNETEEAKLEETELEESFIQLAKILEEKQIVLVGHDSKKSELTELVAEHEEFLSYCLTRTWQTFSDDLYKQTGLSVTQEIPPTNSGGYQAINSLVNSGEIIAVIFLRDLMAPQPGQASEEALLRICNINNVLLATNLPTAQAVLHYLKNLKD